LTEQELMLEAMERATWEAQLLKTAEECGEFIAAALRWCNRAPWSKSESTLFYEVYEEVIDVELMIKQIQVYMDPELLDIQRQQKLARYEQRLATLRELDNVKSEVDSRAGSVQ
jgi:hypothetical protein